MFPSQTASVVDIYFNYLVYFQLTFLYGERSVPSLTLWCMDAACLVLFIKGVFLSSVYAFHNSVKSHLVIGVSLYSQTPLCSTAPRVRLYVTVLFSGRFSPVIHFEVRCCDFSILVHFVLDCFLFNLLHFL